MRALAVTGSKRSAQLKDVPTMDEVGFKGFDAMQWYGSVGPAGMPADVVRRLNETQVAVLKAPDLAEKLASEAVEPWPMTPDQFGKYIGSEIARWTALAKARNIQLDETPVARNTHVSADTSAPPVTAILARFVATHPSRGWSDAVEREAHRTFYNWLGCAIG
eukprot:gene5250-6240_t